jgi:hypothetical protein
MQVAAAVIAIHPAENRMPAPRKHAASCSTCNLRAVHRAGSTRKTSRASTTWCTRAGA